MNTYSIKYKVGNAPWTKRGKRFQAENRNDAWKQLRIYLYQKGKLKTIDEPILLGLITEIN